jgi:hypothetical protein
LKTIGASDGFLSLKSGGNFNSDRRHSRAREIGNRLNQIGGLALMQAVGFEVGNYFDPGSGRGRELEAAWDGIGGWKG